MRFWMFTLATLVACGNDPLPEVPTDAEIVGDWDVAYLMYAEDEIENLPSDGGTIDEQPAVFSMAVSLVAGGTGTLTDTYTHADTDAVLSEETYDLVWTAVPGAFTLDVTPANSMVFASVVCALVDGEATCETGVEGEKMGLVRR